MLLALGAAPATASYCGFYGAGLVRVCPALNLVQQQRYFRQLGTKPTKSQLRQGIFRSGLAPSSSTAASRRAGLDAGSLGLAPLLVVGALALGLAALAAARRPRAVDR